MINLNKITQPFVMGILGSGVGGPVAAVLGTMTGGQLGPLNQMLKGLQGLFGKSQGTAGSAMPQRPLPFSSANININVTINPLGALQQGGGAGPLQSFGRVPEVGNDSQWPGLANQVNSRITGSDAAKQGFKMDGTNPWAKPGDKSDMAAVAWAMQKNDKVRFNADTKQFYTTNADGSTQNVASLDEVKQQIAKAGGANQSNGAAYNAVGAFLDGRVGQANPGGGAPRAFAPQGGSGASRAGAANPFQQLMEMLQKMLQVLTGQGAPGAAGASGVGGGSGGGGGAPVGSGGSSVAPTGGGGGVSGMDSMVSKAGSSIDSMMSQAEQLMASDKPSDQLKGQMLMQKAMRMFEMISKMMEKRSELQSKAIQAMK